MLREETTWPAHKVIWQETCGVYTMVSKKAWSDLSRRGKGIWSNHVLWNVLYSNHTELLHFLKWTFSSPDYLTFVFFQSRKVIFSFFTFLVLNLQVYAYLSLPLRMSGGFLSLVIRVVYSQSNLHCFISELFLNIMVISVWINRLSAKHKLSSGTLSDSLLHPEYLLTTYREWYKWAFNK